MFRAYFVMMTLLIGEDRTVYWVGAPIFDDDRSAAVLWASPGRELAPDPLGVRRQRSRSNSMSGVRQ
jgi:hypothetical protein